jgi:hypothetical protein
MKDPKRINRHQCPKCERYWTHTNCSTSVVEILECMVCNPKAVWHQTGAGHVFIDDFDEWVKDTRKEAGLCK